MSSTKAQKIRRRTFVGGSLALALAGMLWLSYLSIGTWLVFGVGAAIAALATVELTRMGRFRELRVGPAIGTGYVVACALIASRDGGPLEDAALPVYSILVWGGAALLAWSAAGVMRAVARVTGAPRSAAHPILQGGLAAWVAPALPALAFVRADYGANGLVALIVLSKLGDVAGYYVGSAIGKSHPFPNTSPGKTTAGCVASLVVGTLGGAGCVALGLLPSGSLGLLGGLVAGAVINLAAQAGDLLESRAKRWAGVKDSGTWFGPSGGILDLADSLLLSVPAACLTWPFLFPVS